MEGGLAITFDLLTRTPNEAAVSVLLPALDSPDPAIQEAALVAIFRRRTMSGGREILDRMPRMKPEWKAIIRQHRGRMTRTLRDAILGTDPVLCENACRATVWFGDYDLVPTLLSAMEASTQPNADLSARTVMELVEALYDELAGAHDPADRRDPQLLRRYVVGSLEQSVQRFGHHKRREAIECFLLLAGRDNAMMKQILQNPHHPAFSAVMDVLGKNPQKGVIRLLLNLLDDPHAPLAAIGVIARRDDARFIQYLLKKIGREPSVAVALNLKRIESIPWVGNVRKLLNEVDDAGQHAMVRLIATTGIARPQAFAAIEQILIEGKPAGRREAARTLADFHGAEANALAMRALADPDPQVQANIVLQLRGRGIPGVLPRLLEMIESPYDVVRRAARESLSEFNFKRYVAAFDMLDEEVRRSTGALVKKIDPQAASLLKEELKSPLRTRRLRGLAMIRAMDVCETKEATVIEMLTDEDHMVRLEVVATLVQSVTEAGRAALQQAMNDPSEAVRNAAAQSMQRQTRPEPSRQPAPWI